MAVTDWSRAADRVAATMNEKKEKNLMRKLLALGACGVLALGAGACGGDDKETGGGGERGESPQEV